MITKEQHQKLADLVFVVSQCKEEAELEREKAAARAIAYGEVLSRLQNVMNWFPAPKE